MRGHRAFDISGQRFGRLTVIRQLGVNVRGNSIWLCACDCGKDTTTIASRLRAGGVKSCGCLLVESGRRFLRHGHTVGGNSPEFRTWTSMWTRCTNKNSRSYVRYGGRGIAVCERWRSFEAFLADMGPRPAGRSIDRVNNEGNYEPANCRWATPKEQANNRRRPVKR